jgi:hypothetical protein
MGGDDEVKPPPPTLEDVQALTADSDFKRFVTADVPADVKNAAMKKLFADPRYNVMDGLDVYIDDYSKPDPLPEGWLEKMNQVARLGIFKPEPEAPEAAAPDTQAQAGAPDAEGFAPAEMPQLPTREADPASPLPSVTSGDGNDASPVPQSPPAQG